MFRHILLPLDGSALAESVLTPAAYLARVLRAKITLIHIVEKDGSPTVHGERHLTGHEEAQRYLLEVRQKEFSPTESVALHVHESALKDVARGIVEHQDELTPDLVMMCSHGRGGLRDLLFGSIAQQVISLGRTPVLLVRPERATEKHKFECRNLLAPTDGRAGHEIGLETAAGLARATKAQLRLMAVAPTMGNLAGRDAAAGRFLPGTTHAMLDMIEGELQSYLGKMVKRFESEGAGVSAVVSRGDPAALIAEMADAADIDLIVFATHGKAGTKAFWSHSVGAMVLAKTSRPVLLVPVAVDATAG
jgi:nucleotide-binding universal stress UspA family protein